MGEEEVVDGRDAWAARLVAVPRGLVATEAMNGPLYAPAARLEELDGALSSLHRQDLQELGDGGVVAREGNIFWLVAVVLRRFGVDERGDLRVIGDRLDIFAARLFGKEVGLDERAVEQDAKGALH